MKLSGWPFEVLDGETDPCGEGPGDGGQGGPGWHRTDRSRFRRVVLCHRRSETMEYHTVWVCQAGKSQRVHGPHTSAN